MAEQATPKVKLLHADEQQIDRASIPIADGTAFVVVVCPKETRGAALTRFAQKLGGLPMVVEARGAEEMFAALSEHAGQKEKVLSLELAGDVDGALDALNLHREKLLMGGPVLVWLGSVEDLRRLRERAPDAYSFRTTMLLLQGDGGPLPTVRKGDESERVQIARRRWKKAKPGIAKAQAGQHLAEDLRESGSLEEALAVARAALLEIPHAGTDTEREARSHVCRSIATIYKDKGMATNALHWRRRTSAELHLDAFAREVSLRAGFEAEWPGPFRGLDRAYVTKALADVRRYGLGPEEQGEALHAAATVAIAQGNLRQAQRLRDERVQLPASLDGWSTVPREGLDGDLESARGHFEAAATAYRDLIARRSATHLNMAISFGRLFSTLLARGELDAITHLFGDSEQLGFSNSVNQVDVLLERGAVDDAISHLREMMEMDSRESRDGWLFNSCEDLVHVASRAFDASRLSAVQRSLLLHDLALYQDVLATLAGPDGPPWYAIRMRTGRTQVLALDPADLPQALTLDREALDLARQTYPDLLPETARILVAHLLHANDPAEALSLISEMEPLALETGFLQERANLLALRVWARVLQQAAATEIEADMHALREALDATGSERIKAEVLCDLAAELPPTTRTPDPCLLAEEAHRLFLVMPMPAQEARCLEIMGDILTARGNLDEARTRYQTARVRLEHYGLALRLPKLVAKLEA